MKGSIVLPRSLPDDLKQLVPAAPHPAWRLASFSTISQNLGDKIVLLHPHVAHYGGSPMPHWVIDEKEVDAAINPPEPNDSNVPPKIGIYVFPENGQPMSGVTAVKEEEKQ